METYRRKGHDVPALSVSKRVWDGDDTRVRRHVAILCSQLHVQVQSATIRK